MHKKNQKLSFFCSINILIRHTAENEPSGFKSKHTIFFRNILMCKLLSYNLNFQEMPPREF